MNDLTTTREYPPGVPAPIAGTYVQRNVLGASTGVRINLELGETLPAAPRAFTWRLVEPLADRGTTA